MIRDYLIVVSFYLSDKGVKNLNIYENLSLEDLANEEWKDIIGYEGKYKISSLGRVKNINTDKIMKQRLDKNGYPRVNLCNDKQTTNTIHRLVAIHFIMKIAEEYNEVDHINTIRTDNNIDNLRWVTSKINSNNTITKNNYKKSRMGVLNINSKKKVVCCDTNIIYDSISQATKKTGVGKKVISNCCKHKNNEKCKKNKFQWLYYDEWIQLNN